MDTLLYCPKNLDEIHKHIKADKPYKYKFKGVRGTEKRPGYTLYNYPVTFDIETTSAYVDKQKVAFMHSWMICITDIVVIGRSWGDFQEFVQFIISHYKLDINRRMIIWVHNLSFEFQFICHLFSWDSVFALSERTPVKAVTTDGIEFRCSYQLSGQSLAGVAKNLTAHEIEKLKGDLDYDLIRNSKTVLTEKEIGYMVNDVVILKYYIEEQIAMYDNLITRIPITNTSRVRRYCRKQCLYRVGADGKIHRNWQYIRLMERLTLEVDEYLQLKRAFQGGFTHANAIHADQVLHDVTSMDFTSSYPTVMISEKFPMSKGKVVVVSSQESFLTYLRKFCCLFDVVFINLRERPLVYENPLSISKCNIDGKFGVAPEGNNNNGRLRGGSVVKTTLTDVDFRIIQKFYTWDNMGVSNFRIYSRSYLPKSFVGAILELYRQKTELKDVAGREADYQLAKGMLNSLYGMCVTDVDKETWLYDDEEEWHTDDEHNLEDSIEAYNTSQSRFLFYPWGVWVTAYARRNLFSGIEELEDDFCYADTDSVKFLNYEDHKDYFNSYNNWVIDRLYQAMDHHKLDRSLIEPETVEGVKKPLGVWDFDGHYKTFKTMGAKRYVVEYSYDDRNGKHKGDKAITIAGLGKKEGLKYMEAEAAKTGKTIFSVFSNNMEIPAEHTGKLTHTYIDEEREFDITDYQGNTEHIIAKSGVHLEKAPFKMHMVDEYLDYILEKKHYFEAHLQ